jgi:hypothetical protein
MGILSSILTFPLMGPINGVLWIAEQITDQAENELYSPTRVRQQLAELEMRLDLGEISEEEYMAAEDALLARLREIRDRQR